MEHGIAATGRGTTFLTDSTKHRVEAVITDRTGRKQHHAFGSFGNGPGQFSSPAGIAVDGRGRIWVVDSGNHRVQVFSPWPPYNVLFTVGRYGTGNAEFDTPVGIAIDGRDNVFVVDSGNHRIQVFGPDSRYVGGFDTPGEHALIRPVDVAVTNDHVLLIDAGDRQVKRFPNPFRRRTPC